ncbi:patatin-like phospholipase family protein [Lentibacter algarum]|uniref:patatin-like phospholipase family protein n=1 Tax=Lentibacter algarum TaxID=576131 RepID=UPI001C078689|nr:patatin-like phospholipase family protein [Lentibacter algarum]MBU2981440.1 patatin-like phospholipase family protein [Lentibacter algarum]
MTPNANLPKRNILALDGGGVRGIITLAFLEHLQEQLEQSGKGSIHQHFDLIGGTSTGSIIAAGLSLGLSPKDLTRFYMRLGPKVFRKPRFRLRGLQSVFDARMLKAQLQDIIGDAKLDSDRIQTNLAIVAKRMDTGSPWIVHNNPKGAFWQDAPDGSFIGNRNYSLAKLVRASTAAPYYFAPELLEIVTGETPGLFVDGGVSPHNMPGLALLLLVTVPEYGYSWDTGLDRLDIISIGTGTFRQRTKKSRFGRAPAASMAIKAVSSVIADCEAHNLSIMQSLGACKHAWHLNSEIGDLSDFQLGPAPLFGFSRYNVGLEHQWLKDELDITLTAKELALVRDFTDPAGMQMAFDIGKLSAAKQMSTMKF